ncbi:hypothetical protein ACIQM3_07245 [Streptomyces sp. NPDC091271]|uniref:hypothetical protein n=1 Tax=Streptomyces sp. NPDC091271 TaxID=3365980 RepID=UPI0038032A8E
MDFETLRFAKFEQLDAAVTDWSTMVSNLAVLKDDARDGLKAAADKADWSGDNANVTKGFVDKTVREFDDAHKQAKSLWNIVKDTRDELKAYQRQLNEAVERGTAKNLRVAATSGGGFMVTTGSLYVAPTMGPTAPGSSESQHDVDALRGELQKILDKATESDHTGSAPSALLRTKPSSDSPVPSTRTGTPRTRRSSRPTSWRPSRRRTRTTSPPRNSTS